MDTILSPDAATRPYESNPLKLLNPSFEAFRLMAVTLIKLIGLGIGASIITAVPIVIAVNSIIAHNVSPAAVGLVIIAALFLMTVMIYLGYATTRLAIAAARGVTLTWRQALPDTFATAWKTFWTNFLVAMITVAGLFALVVPGILCMLWFSQVSYIAIDEQVYGRKALARSRQLVRHRLLDTAGLFGLGEILRYFGYLPLIGSILNFTFSLLTIPMGPIRYVQLGQLSDEDRESITTSRWNYVLFLLALVIFAFVILPLALASLQKSLHVG